MTTNVPDYVGNITQVKVKQTVGSQTTEYNKYYSYDHRGRLLKVEQQMTGDPQGKVTLAVYTYDELGRQTGKKLHNNSYTTTYVYQVGGRLSAFQSKDLTYMLSYDTLAVPVSGAVAKYDGNISGLRWKNNNTSFKSYTYAYDALGQLTNATYNEQSGSIWSNPSNKFNVNGIGYDQNGNLKSLIRRNSSGGILHNLEYHYDLADNGNALSSVTLNGSASGAFVYDGNGNLTTDGERGINIRYNELNLPAEISKGSEKISYIYSASGEKLAMQAGSSLTYYRDVMVYNGNSLSYVLHPEGIVRKSGSAWVYDYMLTDHTGSTRVLLEASGNALSDVQNTDYYPFGLSFTNNNLDKNKYLYSGKEMQDGMLGGNMLGWYDFGARMYNPTLGRWFCQDPALQLMSPYGFCGNNPIAYVDDDGEFFIGYAFGFFKGLFKGRNPLKEGWKSAVNQEKIRLGLFRPSRHQSGFKQIAEILSRFTWQLPQTLLGYGTSQMINFTSSTKVDFFDGATTISSNWFKGMEAMTLGNFINGSYELKADPNTAPFQHEYGHYLQSREMGWAYLSKVGIPSILSAGGDGNHSYYPVEQDANARAIKYFNEKGILEKWDFKRHPIGDASWNMDNIYKGGTREFADAFNGVLNGVKTSPSFWDYFTFGIPPGILITGGINHNHNKHDSGAVK